MDNNGKITRRTLIPLGIVASLIAGSFLFGKYITNISNTSELGLNIANAAMSEIKELPSRDLYEAMNEKIDKIYKIVNKEP